MCWSYQRSNHFLPSVRATFFLLNLYAISLKSLCCWESPVLLFLSLHSCAHLLLLLKDKTHQYNTPHPTFQTKTSCFIREMMCSANKNLFSKNLPNVPMTLSLIIIIPKGSDSVRETNDYPSFILLLGQSGNAR